MDSIFIQIIFVICLLIINMKFVQYFHIDQGLEFRNFLFILIIEVNLAKNFMIIGDLNYLFFPKFQFQKFFENFVKFMKFLIIKFTMIFQFMIILFYQNLNFGVNLLNFSSLNLMKFKNFMKFLVNLFDFNLNFN